VSDWSFLEDERPLDAVTTPLLDPIALEHVIDRVRRARDALVGMSAGVRSEHGISERLTFAGRGADVHLVNQDGQFEAHVMHGGNSTRISLAIARSDYPSTHPGTPKRVMDHVLACVTARPVIERKDRFGVVTGMPEDLKEPTRIAMVSAWAIVRANVAKPSEETRIRLHMPTPSREGRLVNPSGKRILSRQAESAIVANVPRVMELSSNMTGYVKLAPIEGSMSGTGGEMDAMQMLRIVRSLGMDPAKAILKAGLEM
jgi:hypothetical protein